MKQGKRDAAWYLFFEVKQQKAATYFQQLTIEIWIEIAYTMSNDIERCLRYEDGCIR